MSTTRSATVSTTAALDRFRTGPGLPARWRPSGRGDAPGSWVLGNGVGALRVREAEGLPLLVPTALPGGSRVRGDQLDLLHGEGRAAIGVEHPDPARRLEGPAGSS